MSVDFRIEHEWQDPAGALGPELRATWARLEMRIDGRVLTRVYDHRSRSVREGVYLPLYPLAEWLALDWWWLFHEIKSPERQAEADYAHRHFLRFAREGFALPDLIIESTGGHLDLTWERGCVDHTGIELLEGGSATLAKQNAEDVLRGFVEAVVRRLADQDIEHTPLQEQWRTLWEADEEERAFCAAAAALGLDPYQVSSHFESALVQASKLLPESLFWELLPTASASNLAEEIKVVGRVYERGKSTPGYVELRKLAEEAMGTATLLQPWKQGYRNARNARQRLGLNGRVTLENLIDRLSSGHISTATHADNGRGVIQSLITQGTNEAPAIVVTPKSSPESELFAFCRAMSEALAAGPRVSAVATSSHSDQQKRNRAFAAEFLAPSASLGARLAEAPGRGAWSDEDLGEVVDELAREFGVSSLVVHHQIENHNLLETR